MAIKSGGQFNRQPFLQGRPGSLMPSVGLPQLLQPRRDATTRSEAQPQPSAGTDIFDFTLNEVDRDMSKPIEQALNNLIPRHSGTLPPELLDLASSLLAQSRTKASNLKAEEEIGRAYACANIACERLKSTLNLPPIEPRPPIPPRAYKNLYSYLDRTLQLQTPRRRKAQSATIGENGVRKSLPQRHTPLKEKSLDGFRTAGRPAKRGLQYLNNLEKDDRVPVWVAPFVRFLCRDLFTKNAIPHILAGVESVLCLPPPRARNGVADAKTKEKEGVDLQKKIPALIAALWFFVTCRLQGSDTTGSQFVQRRKLVMETLNEVRANGTLAKKIGKEDLNWEGWVDVSEADVTGCVMELNVGGWLDLDWFTNIEEKDEQDDSAVDEEDEWVSGRDRDELWRAGLGSMKIASFDGPSEKSRKEYERWKSLMIIKIDQLAANGAFDDEMDTGE